MVHSFTVTDNNNGNTTVSFMENTKKRSIIFSKDSDAQRIFKDLSQSLTSEYVIKNTNPQKGIRQSTIDRGRDITSEEVITRMKILFYFKANMNNKSIFRPIHKSLILK